MNIQEGSIVQYLPTIGGLRTVLVTGFFDEDGVVGFDGHLVYETETGDFERRDSRSVWGRFDQITKLVWS